MDLALNNTFLNRFLQRFKRDINVCLNLLNAYIICREESCEVSLSRQHWHNKLIMRCQHTVFRFFCFVSSTDWNQGLLIAAHAHPCWVVSPAATEGIFVKWIGTLWNIYCILYIRVFYFEQFYCTLFYGSLCILWKLLSVFITITHSEQLMPRLHVFVINLKSSGKSLAAAAS